MVMNAVSSEVNIVVAECSESVTITKDGDYQNTAKGHRQRWRRQEGRAISAAKKKYTIIDTNIKKQYKH